jgi:hypothetical protein
MCRRGTLNSILRFPLARCSSRPGPIEHERVCALVIRPTRSLQREVSCVKRNLMGRNHGMLRCASCIRADAPNPEKFRVRSATERACSCSPSNSRTSKRHGRSRTDGISFPAQPLAVHGPDGSIAGRGLARGSLIPRLCRECAERGHKRVRQCNARRSWRYHRRVPQRAAHGSVGPTQAWSAWLWPSAQPTELQA